MRKTIIRLSGIFLFLFILISIAGISVEPAWADTTPKFIKQPNTVYLDDVNDPDAEKKVSFELDFVPDGARIYMFSDTEGTVGYWWNITDTVISGSGSLYCDKSKIIADPYYILVQDKNFITEYLSEPFYVLRKGAHLFTRQPEDVLILDGQPAEVSWSVDYFPEPYTQTTGHSADSTFYITGGHIGFHEAVNLIVAYRMITGDNLGISIEEDRDMSITVDADWVCDVPYQIMIQSPENTQVVHTRSFYVREAWTVRCHMGSAYSRPDTSQQVLAGEKAVAPEMPEEINGYVFGGWYTDPGFNSSFNFNTPITGTLDLYAKWNLKSYGVDFDTVGGSANPPSQIVSHGGKVTRPADPTKAGGTFMGWYTDPGYEHVYDFSRAVTEPLILYAKWEMQTFLVSFNNRGIAANPATQTVTYGEKAVQPADPAAANYIFGGWFKNGGYTEQNRYDFSAPVTQNTNLNAKWTKICTISFDPGDYGTGSMTSARVNAGETFTLPENSFTAVGDHRFRAWSAGSGYVSPGRTVTVYDDMTFTAVWDTIPYRTINFNMNGHGEQVDPMRVEFNTVPAGPPAEPSADGWAFTGWYTTKQGADSGNSYFLFDFTKPFAPNQITVTLYAGWRDMTQYTIHLSFEGSGYGTANLTGTGIVKVNDETYRANPGTVIEVTDITPAEGSVTGEDLWGNDWVRAGNESIGGKFSKTFTMPTGDIYVSVKFTLLPVEEGGHLHNEDTLVHYPAKARTCTVDGWMEHWYCPVCEQWFYKNYRDELVSVFSVEYFTDRAPGHIPGEWIREEEILPTCEDEGYYENAQYCTVCGEELDREFVDELPLGHDWNTPEYVWADDYSSVTATVVCRTDARHVVTETVDAYEYGRDPVSCTESERIGYETDLFSDPVFEPQFIIVDGVSALGHDWDEGSVNFEPGCDYDGETVYTCSRCHESRYEPIPALGHDWDPANISYSWTGDHSSVTATAVCARDCGEEVTETVNTFSYYLTEPDCDTEGRRVYVASFTNDAFPIQTYTVDVPAAGHDWKDPVWDWASDHSSASAVFECRRDAAHRQTQTAAVTSVRTEPTWDADGSIEYTASVTFGGFTYTDMITVTIPKPQTRSVTLRDSSSRTVAVTVNLDTKQVRTVGEVSASAPVFVVSFDANGRFMGAQIIKTAASVVDTADGAKNVSVLWLDSNSAPKTETFSIGF